MSAATRDDGPIVRRLELGGHLRRLREARGITRARAGAAIRSSESKISRIELGRVGTKKRDLDDLLTLYDIDGAERAELLALASEANTPGHWIRFSEILTPVLHSYLDLEQAAQLIRPYEVQFVPELLQTEAYARATIRASNAVRSRYIDRETDQRVALRMARQQVLRRADPPQVWAVIDEAVLHRRFGGVPVLRDQLGALLAATDLPNVVLQVATFGQGGHVVVGGAFTILRFTQPLLSDVVYMENLTGGVMVEKHDEVERFKVASSGLSVRAEPPQRTPDIIRRILRDLT